MKEFHIWVVLVSLGLFIAELWLFWFLKIRKPNRDSSY